MDNLPCNFKMTELGLFPENWGVVRLGEIIKLSSGKTRPNDFSKFPTDIQRYPVFGGNGIMGYSSKVLVIYPTIILGRVGAYCGVVHVTYNKAWITDNALYIKNFCGMLT